MPPREHRQGVCPTCQARNGEACHPTKGRYPAGGTHVKRLRAAGIEPVMVVGTTAYGRAAAAAEREAWARALDQHDRENPTDDAG